MTTPRFDPGSFRDRTSRVVRHDGRILRVLSAAARDDWETLRASPFFALAMAEGRVIGTTPAPDASALLSSLPDWSAVAEC